ncbi:MAG: hypothetical protein A2020_04735 [Lentisphaerae bacterium GWF2_45_14]|nr:MAG: hypothetical protein A2020_04735 [Lentisphaerae bacterium GWF2_45_14]
MNTVSDKLKKLAITCGGTGGHFYPGLTIAEKFKKDGGEVLLLLSGNDSQAQSEIAAKRGIGSVIIQSAPRPRGPLAALKFAHKFVSGLVKARTRLSRFRPDAFLAMGSFASAPSSFAAWTLGIPLFLHDGNARLGRANLFLSMRAKHLFLSFPAVNPDACKCPMSLTGLPVRHEIGHCAISRKEAYQKINSSFGTTFTDSLPLLLIFGGSQGAKTFNEIIPQSLMKQKEPVFQVVHLTGAGKNIGVEKIYSGAKFQGLILEKTEEMPLFYSAADLIICRAGGSSISEIACFGKYAVLVPYPYAADHHQDDNAAYLASEGGAEVLYDGDCTIVNVSNILHSWATSPERYREAGLKNKALAKPDAAADVLSRIASIIT